MADLQEFSKLFTSLENQVVELDKRHGQLEREVRSLEARQSYLKKDIKELEDQQVDAINSVTKANKAAEANQKAADISLNKTKQAEVELRREYQVINSGLKTQKESLQKDLDNINREIIDRRKAVNDLKKEKQVLLDEIENINKQLSKTRSSIDQLNDRFEKKSADIAQEVDSRLIQVAEVEKRLASVKNEESAIIENINDRTDKLEAVRVKLEKAEAKYNDYLKVESERSKALDAREASLSERERQLEVRLITSRRRNPVLDKPA